MKYEIDGVIYEIDSSDLAKYKDPKTGELNLDIFAEDVANAVRDTDISQKLDAAETAATDWNEANNILKETGNFIRPGGSGAWLRTLAAGALPFTSEAEAGLRSALGDETYSQALDAARQSRDDYAAAYPMKALATSVAGGMIPAIATFGAASPISAARTATTGARMLRGLGTGAGLGALYGFGNSRGGFENRLGDALLGMGVGGVAGGLTPAIAAGASGVRNELATFAKGLGKYRLSPEEVEQFMVQAATQNTTTAGKYADILSIGAKAGAEDISDAGVNLKNLYQTAKHMGVPELYTGKTPGGITMGKLLAASESPGYNAKNQAFNTFVSQNQETVEGGIAAASQFLKKHPSAQNVLKQLKLENVDPDTFKWWQNIEQGLTNKLPPKYDYNKLPPAKKKIADAVKEISLERERLFPGVQKANVNMASGISEQKQAGNVLSQRLNTLAQRPSQEQRLGSGVFGFVTKRLDPIMERGRARQLIRTGKPYEGISDKNSRRASELVDSILRSVVSW